MTVGSSRGQGRGRRGLSGPVLSDEGGIWIMTGVVLGLVAYGGVVVLLFAGYTAVIPIVVTPLALAGLIGASNLLGGGRTYGRTPGRPVGAGQAPLSSSGPNGPLEDTETSEGVGADETTSVASPAGTVSPAAPELPGDGP